MKIVFSILLAVSGLLLTSVSQARYWEGNVTCRAFDEGWEEHWGGHSTCGDCLSRHGGCYEKCTTESYRCTVKMTMSDGSVREFRGSGQDRWDAENEASRQCSWSHGGSCSFPECTTDTQVVSQRDCR